MIKLSKIEKNKEEIIKYINDKSFENLKIDSELIKKAHSQLIVFNYFQSNFNEYGKFIEKTSKIPVTIDIRILTSPSLLLKANKLIFNLLSSFKFYIDNTRAFLTRKYRENPKIVANYESLIRQHYNNNFSYRFLTKLRDYAVHIGFPLQGLSFSADPNEEHPEKMVGEIQLLIDIELIKKEKRTFKKMHAEILELKDDIDLNPLIYDLVKLINKIQRYVHSFQENEIKDSIENIETFVGNHKKESNDIYIFYNMINKPKTVEFNSYKIPFEMINDFKKHKNWC